MMFNSKYSIPGKAKYERYSIGYSNWFPKEGIGFRICSTLDKETGYEWQKPPIAQEIEIEIEVGRNVYSLPPQLAHIALAVTDSKVLLELEDDWNYLNAKGIAENTWNAAVNFLVRYAKYTYDNFGAPIVAPEMNPCPNGAIDLAWKTTQARLLVNFKEHEDLVMGSYYGDLFNNEQAIKNVIKDDDSVIEHLAFWMKNLAK